MSSTDAYQISEYFPGLSKSIETYYSNLKPSLVPQEMLPYEIMPYIMPTILIVLETLASLVDKEIGLPIGKLLSKYLKNALEKSTDKVEESEEKDAANVSGIIPLSALLSIMIGKIDNETLLSFTPALNAFILYFTVEKFSDDLGGMDEKGRFFTYGDLNKAFIEFSIQAIQDDSFDLAQAIQVILENTKTAGIATEMSKLVDDISSNLDAPTKVALNRFLTNPNAYFLALNLVSAHTLKTCLKDLIVKNKANPDLVDLLNIALSGLLARYTCMLLDEDGYGIIDNPAMPIEIALVKGKQSILTDTFAGVLAAAAAADNTLQIRQGVEANKDEIENAIESFSFLIRCLNDAGSTLIDYSFTLDQLQRVRQRIGTDRVPRELFKEFGELLPEKKKIQDFVIDTGPLLSLINDPHTNISNSHYDELIYRLQQLNIDLVDSRIVIDHSLLRKILENVDALEKQINNLDCPQGFSTIKEDFLNNLMNIQIKLLQNFFSRFIKDSVEQEYSTIYNSGQTEEVEKGGVESIWTIFQNNISFSSTNFKFHMLRFIQLVQTISLKNVYSADFLARKMLFNIELYAQLKGDYDRKGEWNSLLSMTQPNAIYVLIQVIDGYDWLKVTEI